MIGDRIAERLAAIGITQRELAEEIGITEVSVARYINGSSEPKASVLREIAEALDTTPDYLLDF